jgi:hypothetical protein
MSISRRDLLKSIAMSAAGSTLGARRLEAARRAHRVIDEEKAASAASRYTPKYFSAHQYQTLRALCQAIIPPDGESGGALQAGAPEFIDLLTSENQDYQLRLGGGLEWLDATCHEQHDESYLECTEAQQREILDLIAYRKNAEKDARLRPGIEFFSILRKLTADGFFTSKIGIEYLGYVGNTYLKEFSGCPPVPETCL